MNEYNKTRELDITEIDYVNGGNDTDCYYADEKYEDGDTITHSDGTTQTCQAGTWQ